MSFFVGSNQQRTLRACMVCSVVQLHSVSSLFSPPLRTYRADFFFPLQKFNRDGCPNCEEYLSLRGNPEAIAECTSQVFEGLITLADPGTSWVARWQRLDGYVPGTYAVKVQGSVRFTLATDLLYLCDWDHRTDWWCYSCHRIFLER